MVIYIHGFGGSGEGVKSTAFRSYFRSRNIPFISPSLSYIPELALNTLEELIESYDKKVTLIGSSLGGFYSIYLSQKYNVRAVLINPSIFPYETLANYTGDAPSFYDTSSFKWTDQHVESLKQFTQENVNHENFFLMVQKGDELLDFQKAVDKFYDAKQIVEDSGDHSFVGIDRHFQSVEEFLTHEQN